MAVQNMYNNYLKRQNQNSTNQFRQKVANSLSGKSVNNNTTQNKTPSMMGNTLGNGVQVKPKTVTPTQPTVQRSVTPPNASPTPTNAITTPQPQNLVQSNITPSGGNLNAEQVRNQQIQAQNNLQVPNNLQAPNITPQSTNLNPEQIQTQQTQANGELSGLGMMSLEDINNYVKTDEQVTSQNETDIELSESDMQEIDALANTPEVARVAKAKKKTPQEIAHDILVSQKEQAKQEWLQQQKALQLQRDQLAESNKQSIKDADNAYKTTEKDLQLNRYTQQQDLAVSGQNRGIQYSPQQLALENVANINLNKNLAEASTKRNELLNNLAIQLGQSLAQVDMGLQNATVEYNKNVAGFMNTYQQQMADWAYNDQQTESERKWQEEQAKKDKEFEKEMANAQNKWQSGENALDRKQYSKSSSGYSGYSYGGSSYGSSYTPYSSGSGRSYTQNDLDLGTEEGSAAFLDTFKNSSTDLYNSLSTDSYYDVNERGQIYTDEMDQMIEYAKENGMSDEDIAELEKTRQVATQDLYKRWYGQNTNQDYQIQDTIYKPNSVVNKEKAQQTKKKAFVHASKYNSIVDTNPLTKGISKSNYLLKDVKKTPKTSDLRKKVVKKKTQNTKAGSNNDFVYKPKKTSFKQTEISKRTAQKISTSKKNISTAKKSVQKTTNKKASQNNSKRTQDKFKKSFSNIKKNIKKFFNW